MRVRILLLFSTASILTGQDEASLRRYFEGKSVRLKLDMPGTQQGVDIRVNQDPPLDASSYSHRVKNFGTALRAGDVVRVTMVRVKSKNIEFQLNGGGYGTFGDDTGSVTAHVISKTSREQQLEQEVKRETDSKRRDQLNRELGRLQSEREREQAHERRKAAELQEIKRAEIADKRRNSGSRFNLWYPAGYLAESAPTPEQVTRALSEYVDFGDASSAPAPPVREERSSQFVSLRRGMTRDEVESMLGRPSSTAQRNEGSLVVHTATWDSPDQVTVVDFIDSLVIKFRTSSK